MSCGNSFASRKWKDHAKHMLSPILRWALNHTAFAVSGIDGGVLFTLWCVPTTIVGLTRSRGDAEDFGCGGRPGDAEEEGRNGQKYYGSSARWETG
jgi:hypothetical protein